MARLVYTGWYYLVATEKNPSGRTVVFGIGLFANLGLFIAAMLAL